MTYSFEEESPYFIIKSINMKYKENMISLIKYSVSWITDIIKDSFLFRIFLSSSPLLSQLPGRLIMNETENIFLILKILSAELSQPVLVNSLQEFKVVVTCRNNILDCWVTFTF